MWQRSSKEKWVQPETPPVDVDELCTIFASKLHLRNTRKQDATRNQFVESTGTPWYASRITIPLSAPLPSFLPCTILPSTLSPHSVAGHTLDSNAPLHPALSLSHKAIWEHASKEPPFDKPPITLYHDSAGIYPSRSLPQSRSSSFSSISPEPVTPPLSPTIDDSALIFAEDDFTALNEVFHAATHYPSDKLSGVVIPTNSCYLPPSNPQFFII